MICVYLRFQMSKSKLRKRFGQHFLHDPGVLARIIAAFDPKPTDHVVEIGPGRGALTRRLAGKVGALAVIEVDRDLAAALRSTFPFEQITVYEADALGFDLCALAGQRKLRLIGNLPYNISTPLLFRFLDQLHCVEDMLFMLQKEVVARMAAGPGGKDYGRLSVMIQWRLRVERLFDIGPGAFAPPPKVDSSVVRLTPHARPPIEVRDPPRFAAIVQAAFSRRRKTLRNSLKGFIPPEIMWAVGIDPTRRAETLSLEEFATLSAL